MQLVTQNLDQSATDLRTIMLVDKNEELAEEKDRKIRTKNVIINGKCKVGTASN